ncbi:hypothetical protein B0I37DRAFT_1049 [Chaetomium sp. MPI-CAGE-AT-0009]|nr:hypothetical protein B0I37DRAFT_1049 [Chaetomium sp. MPI-CAGE-AT-0009]
MAAFDPIEFFGIGHNRDIAIPRHTRAGSQNSIILSSLGQTPCATLPKDDSEHRRPAQFQARHISVEPQPLHYAFADITPESSVYTPTSSLGVPLLESPNVSVNSSWASDLGRPFSIGRYMSNHERHETILLSLSTAPRRTMSSIPDVSTILPPSKELGGADERSGPSGLEFPERETPHNDQLYRYLTDFQRHELLSVGFERKSHQPSETKAPCSHQDSHKTASSISLSASLDGGEQLAQDDDAAFTAEVARWHHEIRRERALANVQQPRRLHKIDKMRRRTWRDSESLPRGHRDKKARRR